MPRNPLATLIKVRRLAYEDALGRLASALANEDRAAREAHDIERTIAEEMVAASDPEGSDAMVEAFGAWLPRARQQLESIRHVLAERQAETVRVRAELTVCRTALESVESLHEQRRAAAHRAEERAQARELEDLPPRSPDITAAEPQTT